jgi:uncharacterized delta-60 repeat protein
MKIRTALLLIPVLLALCAGTAAAKTAPTKSGVDPSFGHGGKIALSVPYKSTQGAFAAAVAPSNKSYVLSGSLLLAFGANGRPDTGFGTNGRVQVAAAAGETTEVTGLAVDARGRILVSGSVKPTPGVKIKTVPPDPGYELLWGSASNAFVVRFLPNGERDPTFGGAGEIDATLTQPAEFAHHAEVPIVQADHLAIAGDEQPILAGNYWYDAVGCMGGGAMPSAFVAPIDPAGAAFQNIAPTLWTKIATGAVGELTPMPNGNIAALGREGNSCGPGPGGFISLTALTYGGQPAPVLDPGRPNLDLSSLAVDSQGRYLGIERGGEQYDGTIQPRKVVRLQSNGDVDTSFGSNGGLPLKRFGQEPIRGLAIDERNRVVIAGGRKKFRVVRLTSAGKIDQGFVKGGWVEVGFGAEAPAAPLDASIDTKGRVLVAGLVTNRELKTGYGVALTRILPGS